MDNLFAIDLRQIDLSDAFLNDTNVESESTSGGLMMDTVMNKSKFSHYEGGQKLYKSFFEEHGLGDSLKNGVIKLENLEERDWYKLYYTQIELYLRDVIGDKELLDVILQSLYHVERGDTHESIYINKYIIFDKNEKRIIYYNCSKHSYLDKDYFTDKGCRILNTKNSFNFSNYNTVCISPNGNVLWGVNKFSKYVVNKDIIPCIHTRKGKIKMLLNGI